MQTLENIIKLRVEDIADAYKPYTNEYDKGFKLFNQLAGSLDQADYKLLDQMRMNFIDLDQKIGYECYRQGLIDGVRMLLLNL